MSQFDNTPIMPASSGSGAAAPGPAGWISIWIKVITQPKEQTFIDITESPEVSAKTAYIWAFIAGTLSAIIQAFATAIRSATGVASQIPQIPGLEKYIPQSTGGGGVAAFGASLFGGLCAAPFAGLLSIVFFALFVAIIQWIAKLFGGAGTYEKLLYALAAITVPFTIVSSLFALLSVIPLVGICISVISFGVAIYSLVLQVMAVKAVNRFGWGQAAGSVFLPGCVIFIICACVVAGALVVMGPMIGNVFSGINQNLPVP